MTENGGVMLVTGRRTQQNGKGNKKKENMPPYDEGEW